MSDISTIWSPSLGLGDWYFVTPVAGQITDEYGFALLDDSGTGIGDGLFQGARDLVVGDDLGTAVLISLFTDATAGADDILPDASADPRGWWGDLGADRPVGSKIWLRLRSKQTAPTLALVKADIEAALQWLLDDGVASAVAVTTEWVRRSLLGARVIVTRVNGQQVPLQYAWAWKDID